MNDEPHQKRTFLRGEGDQYHLRNIATTTKPSIAARATVRILKSLMETDRLYQVLEIGCGAGFNLHLLSKTRKIKGYGVDPSEKAVTLGNRRHSGLRLAVGSADSLSFPDNAFDIVWFGFCLYLVDRSLLHVAVAEADRVLREDGLLAITDFDPGAPCRRAYRHQPDLSTFKMDYSRLFLANPAYQLVEKHATGHATDTWNHDPQERVSVVVCRKDNAAAYKLVGD